jgi:dTDP-4-dehydrorhamnose reductase
VFGHTENEVDEKASTNPIGRYGLMKKEVEDTLMYHENFRAVRFSYIFSKKDKFTQYLTQCSINKVEAEVFHPLERSVICLDDIVIALSSLPSFWEDISTPFINLGGSELVSRIDIAESFKQNCQPHLKYKLITPPDSFYLARPKTINMKSSYMEKLLKRKPKTLNEMIIENCE